MDKCNLLAINLFVQRKSFVIAVFVISIGNAYIYLPLYIEGRCEITDFMNIHAITPKSF